jgi:hypothetical protein
VRPWRWPQRRENQAAGPSALEEARFRCVEKPIRYFHEVILKRTPAPMASVGSWLSSTESDMNAAIAWLLPRASAKSVADIDSALSVAIFSGLGLLLSLAVLIIDKYSPGEWF